RSESFMIARRRTRSSRPVSPNARVRAALGDRLVDERLRRHHEAAVLHDDVEVVSRAECQLLARLLRDHDLTAGANLHRGHGTVLLQCCPVARSMALPAFSTGPFGSTVSD